MQTCYVTKSPLGKGLIGWAKTPMGELRKISQVQLEEEAQHETFPPFFRQNIYFSLLNLNH